MSNLPSINECNVCVIGMGYVGLPLAIEIAKTNICFKTKSKLQRNVFGYDIDVLRINELNKNIDKTREITNKELEEVNAISFTHKVENLYNLDVFLVTVPTPINKDKSPDLLPLKKASKLIGEVLKKRNILGKKVNPIIVFESTVYPGATEEICIPIIEEESNLKLNNDKLGAGFYCGYSPERINPGDNSRKITNIVKVTSGSNKVAAEWINNFYASFIKAGTHLAPSIIVAEAAKIIENTQRDINIALMNELAIIFNKLDICTADVLDAAKTKWNF